MSKQNGFDNTEIDVEGVVPEKRDAATQEIRWFLKVLRNARGGVRIKRVIVAKDFSAKINELSSVCRTFGIKYEARRRAVHAVAKILEDIEDGNITFVLVFDGTVFGSWDERAKAFRFEKLLHELMHTMLDSQRFESYGAENFYPTKNIAEEACSSLGCLARDEYVVNRIVDGVCREYLTDDTHQAVGLAKLGLAEGFDFCTTLTELLGSMPDFVRQNIQDFKLWRIRIEELWRRVYEFLEELLTVFAYCAAAYDKEQEWSDRLGKISETPAYKSFLEGHLESIHKEWRKWFEEPAYKEAVSLEVIQKEVRQIFQRCGLTLSNLPEGMYVKVDFIK